MARFPATPIADQTTGHDMLYSSGTTGRPKGVLPVVEPQPIDFDNPLLAITRKLYGMDENTIYLSPAPLYHAAPLRFNMSVMRLGGTSVIMEHFDAEEFLRLVGKYRITHTQVVPTMFVRFLKLPDEVRLKYDVSSLRCAIHAAAPCPIPVKEKMIDWWGPIVWEYYGGTEGNGLTMCNAQEWMAHKGTVGRAVVGTLRICDEDGNELPAGQSGTVYFADGRPFEYHNDPRKTAESRHAKGWTTLGDVGYVDADGFLHLTDRKAFMIISGGVNIYPQECENLLIDHPKVMDCAVFGVPNADFGEEVKAVVQPRDMADAGPAWPRSFWPIAASTFGHQVSAQHRLRGRAAAPSHRKALQAPAARPLLAGSREQDRLLAIAASTFRPSSVRAASTSRPNCRAIPPESFTSACCATVTGRVARAGR